MFEAPLMLKPYQRDALSTLRKYFAEVIRIGNASTAFYEVTKRPYREAPGLPGLPYICLRVPTGGGKTIMAAHSISIAADALLKVSNPLVLWLVPSQTIRDQTLKSLRSRSHSNRRALTERFGDNVRVMDIAEALYSKRSDFDGNACIIVSTVQSFRVEETEGRKVYDPNGELMDHFSGLPNDARALLELGPNGDPVPSLANAIRLRRPLVLVDEAHNARTTLSFNTLSRLAPSAIIEFTATPQLAHDPTNEEFSSNVVHHASAAELKAADMIKLPVVLRGRSDPKETIADAIVWLDDLTKVARDEESETGDFIRPIMLLQSERRSKDKKTIHFDEVKRILVEDFRIPPDQIAVVTGNTRELDDVDLLARDCELRFIITQQALKEGWDCSFAYILCSVAEQKSAVAVEQLLGRVLRMPSAKRKKREELNRAYAFATTTSFQRAASTLKDGLVANGFERIEADSLVSADQAMIGGLEDGGSAYVHEEDLPKGLNLEEFKKAVEPASGGRIQIDTKNGRITARGALTDIDATTLRLAAANSPAKVRLALEAFVHKTRGARLAPTAAHEDRSFQVPRLVVLRNGRLELFDRSHFLDTPWKLETSDPKTVSNAFLPSSTKADEAHVDVSSGGAVTVSFIQDLHEQLALGLEERNWTKPALVNWLDRALPRSSRLDITPVSSKLFIANSIDQVMTDYDLPLETVARSKYRLVDALTKSIAEHRDRREATAFQQAVMFPQSGLEFDTSADIALTFEEARYSYNQPYQGSVAFRKHFARIVGDLEPSGEEHDCAVYIDNMPEVKSWARNTARQPNSFWLQTSSDKFYPDFVCLLTDQRVLVVEYKGKNLVSTDDTKEKDLIGQLWSDRSSGKCLFITVTDRKFAEITNRVAGAV